MKRIGQTLFLIIGFFWMAMGLAGAEERFFSALQAAQTGETASVQLQAPVQLAKGPGFRIQISKWAPKGLIELYAIAPQGEQVSIIPSQAGVTADEKGQASFDLPYAFKKFYPGTWILVVGGPGGVYSSPIAIE